MHLAAVVAGPDCNKYSLVVEIVPVVVAVLVAVNKIVSNILLLSVLHSFKMKKWNGPKGQLNIYVSKI